MILSVTLNPSVDIDFIVDGLRSGGRYRTNVSRRSPGGSGINVSIILSRLGHVSTATGFLAGFEAYYILESLRQEGITTNFIHTQGEIRINACITDTADNTETRMQEIGVPISKRDIEAFLRNYNRILGRVDRVVIGGSLPPGTGGDLYAALIATARNNSVPIVVHPRPENLDAVLAEFPTVVEFDFATFEADHPSKENEDERLGAFLDQARKLHNNGTEWVVAFAAPNKIIFSTQQGVWTAEGPSEKLRYFYASSDALLAGLLAGLEEKLSVEQTIRLATACYCECTAHPEKFPENRSRVEEFLPLLSLTEID